MNVYDFDGTIYDGDSSIDFYCYILRRKPIIMRRLPNFFLSAVRYKAGKISKTELKQVYFGFLQDVNNIDQVIDEFWQEHFSRIKPWYLSQKRSDDVIISASPAFLLQGIAARLEIGKLIASDVDPHTGQFLCENCHGKKKVEYFCACFLKEEIDQFYSDNESDLPMAQIAKESYLVKGNQRSLWKKH